MGRGGERRGGELKCYIHTDIQTEPLTKRVLEEHSLLKRTHKITKHRPSYGLSDWGFPSSSK